MMARRDVPAFSPLPRHPRARLYVWRDDPYTRVGSPRRCGRSEQASIRASIGCPAAGCRSRAHPFPVLLLTTTGRRSGRARTTPLIYVRGDGDVLVVGSESFGQKRPAAWPLNRAADPRAAVCLGSQRHVRGAPRLARRGRSLLAGPAEGVARTSDLLRAQRRAEGLRARAGRRRLVLRRRSAA